jgi:hypothetical protein
MISNNYVLWKSAKICRLAPSVDMMTDYGTGTVNSVTVRARAGQVTEKLEGERLHLKGGLRGRHSCESGTPGGLTCGFCLKSRHARLRGHDGQDSGIITWVKC